MSDGAVFDASAILAAIGNEDGADVVARALRHGGVISALNAAEVVGRLTLHGRDAEATADVIDGLDLLVLPFDRDFAHACGRMIVVTKPLGLSLADRACIQAGRVTGLPVLTADQSWLRLPLHELGVVVEVIR